MLTFSDVKQWRPGPLGSSADGLRRSVTRLEAARDQVEEQAVPESWSGLARLMAQVRQNLLVSQMDDRVGVGRTLVRALADAETSVAALRRSVEDVEGEAAAKELRIDSDGSVTDLADPPTFDSRWEAEEYSTTRTNAARGIADEVGRIVDRAAEIDSALLAAVPYRTEDQELRGLADPVVSQRWGELSDTQRQAVLEEVVTEELDDLDLDPPPDVTFVDPDTSTDPKYQELTEFNGYWFGRGENEIWIHPDRLADPEALSTAAHEARHARQADAIDDLGQNPWEWLTGDDPFDKHEDAGVSEEEAESWKENWDGNYIEEPYDDYVEQPVEEDAFDRGSDYLDDLAPEELDRLLEETS